jgi:hypothetical protein
MAKPETMPHVSESDQKLEAAQAFSETAATASGCEAQGIGVEESFAQQMCAAANDFEFKAVLVHSYGAGGVDLFISEADALILRRNPSELRRQTIAITEWAKQNYSGFNAVEVTIVGGDSKIAKGRKIGADAATVELY